MKISTILLALAVCVSTSSLHSASLTTSSRASKCTLIKTIAKRIEALVNSLNSDPRMLYADTVFAFGTTSHQIQLLRLGNRNRHLRHCLPSNFKIQVPFEIRTIVAPKILKYQRSDSYDTRIYYKVVKPILRIFKKLYFETKWKSLPPEKISKFSRVSPHYLSLLAKYDEKAGDACFKEVLQSKSKCAISEKCKSVFGKDLAHKKVTGYHLTHQIMYNMFLREVSKGSCKNKVSTNFLHFFEDSCAKVFSEFKYLTSLNLSDYPTPSADKASEGHDLAMEQAFVCGALGFKEFFSNLKILQKIFTWQDMSTGCFMRLYNEFTSPKTRMPSRRLMTETFLNNKCSPHATGVGAGFYSMYLRYLYYDAAEA